MTLREVQYLNQPQSLLGAIKSKPDPICWQVENDGLGDWRVLIVYQVELRESMGFCLQACEDIVERSSEYWSSS